MGIAQSGAVDRTLEWWAEHGVDRLGVSDAPVDDTVAFWAESGDVTVATITDAEGHAEQQVIYTDGAMVTEVVPD